MTITLHKSAEKYIRRLPERQQRRLLLAIYQLPKGDVKPLTGEPCAYRLRVGDWRVVYDMRDDKIIVRNIGNRGDVYK